MDPVCYGRAFITNTSDLATLVKCQLGGMEEPKESTDKVSWTVYRAPTAFKVWECRQEEDAKLKLSTIKQTSNRYDVNYFLYMHQWLNWQSS